jgi:hypothetical protein
VTCFVPLTEEHNVTVLRFVFGLKTDKVTENNFVIDTLCFSGRPKEVEGLICDVWGRTLNALHCMGRET